MGRKSAVPEGDDFLPGVTLGDLKLLMKKEKDPKNLKRYLVAYNCRAGKTINEIAEVTSETRETVRRWVSITDRKGLDGIPRCIARGAARLLTRRQRVALVKAAHKGPREFGYKTDVWTYKDLRYYAKKKFGTTISYTAAVRRFHEMGIVLKTPRPRHPNAASEEERAAYQRDTRKEILKYARRGYVVVSMDEAHPQSYKNTLKTLGLRGIETSADSSVGRARLSVFGGAGDGFFYLKAAEAGNGAEFIKFCERLLEMFDKVQVILDRASYSRGHKFLTRLRALRPPCSQLPVLAES